MAELPKNEPWYARLLYLECGLVSLRLIRLVEVMDEMKSIGMKTAGRMPMKGDSIMAKIKAVAVTHRKTSCFLAFREPPAFFQNG